MSSEYSKLNINRECIRDALTAAFSNAKIEGPLTKGQTTQWLITCLGQEAATLALFYCGDGRTTINPSVGKNTELAKQAADAIKNRCIINDRKDLTLSIKSVPENDHTYLIQHLRDECGATIADPEIKPNEILHRVKGRHGDTLVIHRYTNGRVMVQGRPVTLYCQLVEILSELLPEKDIIEAQLKSFNLDFTVVQATKELEHTIPTAFSFLPGAVRAILTPAITLRKVKFDAPDYSCLVYPALRGLEGYNKQLFVTGGLTVGRDGFADFFDMTKDPPHVKPSVRFEMAKRIKTDSELNATCAAIVESYQFLRKHRHGLFHADGVPDMSRIIEDRNVADTLVGEVFGLIESTYVKVQAAKS